MKKIFTCLFIIYVGILFANPIMHGPRIVEIYRYGDDWQITLYNEFVIELNLDNCGLSTNSGFSEFNEGIDFSETAIVTYEDLQDSLYIDWESDMIKAYYDEDYGLGYGSTDTWFYAPNTFWANSVNPLYSGQALHEYEPMMFEGFLVKYSDIPGSLGIYGFLEGNVYDVNNNPVEDASVKFYNDTSWLEDIFPPTITDDQGFFNTQIYAKNYEVSACINGIAYLDTFLTIEPDSTTFVEFYTDYDPSSFDNNEISLPSSHYNLSNYPNPFNPSTTISFDLTSEIAEDTEIQIFNSKGQKIRQFPIFNEQSSITWDGTNSIGRSCPSGVYLYKLVSNGKELAANKMLLLK